MGEPRLLCVDLNPRSFLGKQLKDILASTCRVVYVCDHASFVAAGHSHSSSRNARFESVIVVSAAGERSGLENTLRQRPKQLAELPFLIVTDIEEPEEMANLLRLGATDFVIPPLKRAEVLARIWRLVDRRGGEDPISSHISRRLEYAGLVGEHPRFRACVDKIPLYASCDATVMIEGETGTGKDVCARAIHYLSSRSSKPFVPVACGAIPVDLMENELFGHERAAFTGASSSYAALVCAAEGGTMFLDEIDCLTHAAQSKLLGLLHDRSYRPLGSPKTRTANIRLIAACNTDLEEAVRRGKLRPDLYYRLNVLPMKLPPLRERSEDIPLLAAHFLRKFSAELDRGALRLSNEAAQALVRHGWPGNVRELEHVVERAAILTGSSGTIRVAELLIPFSSSAKPQSFQAAKSRVVAQFEISYINNLLRLCEGNITWASREAKKNRRAFWELMRKHRIDARAFVRDQQFAIPASGSGGSPSVVR